jgi:soluble lytic murein transglycosylase-like protein
MTRFDDIVRHLKNALPRPAALAAWMAIGVFALLTGVALTGGRDRLAAPEPQSQEAQTAQPAHEDPSVLSTADRGLYVMILEKQQSNDFTAADELMTHLANTNLLGYVLADRYLNTHYKPGADELKLWLANYADHPQARHIASLARMHGVAVIEPKIAPPLKGEGYTDHLGRTTMPDSWFTALTDWREGNFEKANAIFAKLSEDDDLSDWQRSAAYYWTYRTNDKLGESSAAETALNDAAKYPTTFYGLIASAQLGRHPVVAEAPEVTSTLRKDPRAIRAALLTQIGQSDDAEAELRALYSAATPANRRGIVTLASEMNMPNLQMRLAHTPGLSAQEAMFAQFPAPQYMVDLHPLMDSALLLSVARNESGFREVARNQSSGALGMMQMLPATARAVEKRVGQELVADAGVNTPIAERLSNPAMSARYAAEYLKILAREPAINGNLINLLVGYNAGPATVVTWKSAGRNVNDPLLYVESIPYSETRNYVMQVSAQYWVYQLMMDETPTSLDAIAHGQWPQLPHPGA